MVRDRGRHGAEDAERSQRHHVIRQLEHHGDDGVEENQERLRLLPDVGGRDPDQCREDDDLQDVLLGHRVDHVGGKEMQESLHEGFGLGQLLARGGQGQSLPRTHNVGDRESQNERGGRRGLEIDDRLHSHAPDCLDVTRLADPHDDRREDQRHDQHLDQADEGAGEEASENEFRSCRIETVL